MDSPSVLPQITFGFIEQCDMGHICRDVSFQGEPWTICGQLRARRCRSGSEGSIAAPFIGRDRSLAAHCGREGGSTSESYIMKRATSATTAIADLSELALSQHVAEGQDASATVVVIRLKDRPGVDHRLCHHQSGFLQRLDQAG